MVCSLAASWVSRDSMNSSEKIEQIAAALKQEPKSALLWFDLGIHLLQVHEYARAEKMFEQTITLCPDMQEAWCQLGVARRNSGNVQGSVQSLRQAIILNPSASAAYRELALSLIHDQRFDDAAQEAQKAVEYEPSDGSGWLLLAMARERSGHYEGSLDASVQAIILLPDHPESWLRKGIVLNRLGRHEDAIEAYQTALSKKPILADAWDNLAQSYQFLNRLDEAEAAFHQTLRVTGQTIENYGEQEIEEQRLGSRHFHLAILELMMGKYKCGFDRYRARFKEIGGYQRPQMLKPLWKGESLKGRTILVYHEQGYGDVLMLARYLPLLKEQGAHIVFAVFPAMYSFFKEWSVIDELVLYKSEASIFAKGQPQPVYDYYASIFDLPYRFATSLETIPGQIPYLPLPKITNDKKLPDDNQPRIGVIWAGNPHPLNMKRSMPLPLFAELFKENKVQFYNLTRDLRPGDESLMATLPVIDLRPRINNFSDSACFMQQMDLIITCDSATAHLAGGLGRPVWTFLQFNPAWMWMTSEEKCPWYPTMRLFRQRQAGHWMEPLENMKRDLQAYIERHKTYGHR